VKARKEMSQLLSKADALTASVSTPPVVAAPEPAPRPTASVPSVPAAPAEAQPPAPAKPTADVARDQALAGFRDRLVSLRRTAEASRLKKDRYQQVCQAKVPPSECQQLTSDIADATATIERELGDIQQGALRARIDSGAMHDLLARYGF
jgi:hypothetical protein